MAKQETTATDIAPAKLADEKAAANFKLDPHLINLMWSEPCFLAPSQRLFGCHGYGSCRHRRC